MFHLWLLLSVISSVYVIALPSSTRKCLKTCTCYWTRRKDICALCSPYHQAPVSHKHLLLQCLTFSPTILSYYLLLCYLLKSFLGWRRQQSKEERKEAGGQREVQCERRGKRKGRGWRQVNQQEMCMRVPY